MATENKRKTLIDIDLAIWGKVKHFATIKEISVNEAVELLLGRGLSDLECIVKNEIAMSAGESLATTSQQTPQVGVHE